MLNRFLVIKRVRGPAARGVRYAIGVVAASVGRCPERRPIPPLIQRQFGQEPRAERRLLEHDRGISPTPRGRRTASLEEAVAARDVAGVCHAEIEKSRSADSPRLPRWVSYRESAGADMLTSRS